ncbi:FAD:protein FMN transferase [bacterium]|nr:FAD:protein FMN transferase [bacterium]
MHLHQRGAFWVGEFRAMASPCEVHVEHPSRGFAKALVQLAMDEALRIETVFSRYRDDNIIWNINNSGGNRVRVDDETARMLDFAHTCHDMSDGLFDITSGVLREVWQFDGSNNVPTAHAVDAVLPRVGWEKTHWEMPWFTLPDGMQIDLGGIGKEYAVDRSVALLNVAAGGAPFLVNFGGDLHASKPPQCKPGWQVGVEAVKADTGRELSLELQQGALTTSGDAQRFLLKAGVRYGHVLNPQTGWPAPDAPSSVTVAGDSCLQAGVLSTLALLKGVGAEAFLDEHNVTYWCQR